MNGQEALERLMTGNAVFSAGEGAVCPAREEIAALRDGQNPIAAIVGCADSRVPPNLVFGCTLGELFVVRTAGNVLSEFELGSVEYAVCVLGVPLVLVLGHSSCGAIAAALRGDGETAPGALGRLLEELRPAAEQARSETDDPARMASLAEDYNIRHTVEKLRADPALREVSELRIVGGKYDLCTGIVSLLPE